MPEDNVIRSREAHLQQNGSPATELSLNLPFYEAFVREHRAERYSVQLNLEYKVVDLTKKQRNSLFPMVIMMSYW
jgi:hypothetical protein